MKPIANFNLQFLITISELKHHQRQWMNKSQGKVYFADSDVLDVIIWTL